MLRRTSRAAGCPDHAFPWLGRRPYSSGPPGHRGDLPWNLREEIIQQLAYIREWGGRFATFVPRLWIG